MIRNLGLLIPQQRHWTRIKAAWSILSASILEPQILVSPKGVKELTQCLIVCYLQIIGVSFAPSVETATDKINIIKDWPSNPGVVSKVPSIIAYAEENHDDELEEDAWGFSVNGGMTSYVFTKLLLGQDSRSTETRLKGLFGKGFCTLPDNKSAQDVCTDYLRGIYHHVVKKIEKPNPVLFRVTPLEFWITVPAIWKEHAKTATLHAARDAGFGSRRIDTVHLITEPEAAALSVLVPKVGIDADIELDVRVSPNFHFEAKIF